MRPTVSAHSGWKALAADDCPTPYEELKAKGGKFTEEPTGRFYGIDAAFAAPSATAARPAQADHGRSHRAVNQAT
jgi:hypothetical protein